MTTPSPTGITEDGIALPALDGRLPLGFLAAVGTLRLISENYDPATKLSWSPTTVTPHLRTIAASDITGLTELLQTILRCDEDTRIPGMPRDFPPLQAAPDPLRATPSELARRVAEWQTHADPGLVADWTRALVTDLALDRKNAAEITPLAAPSGKQSFGTMFTKTVDGTRSRPSALHEAFAGWHRVDHCTGEYLDHHVLRDAADSTTGKSIERGVPGATWLALMALPLFPVTGDSSGRRRGTGWQRIANREVMRWPLWRTPLDLHAVRCLIDHPALSLGTDHKVSSKHQVRLQRLEVFALGSARRVRIPGRNFDGVLTSDGVIPLAD